MVDLKIPRRCWAVGFVLPPELAPATLRAEARQRADRPFRRGGRPRYWTFRGACRVAARWNERCLTGSFEVFGPAGKELDGADG